MRISDWSSDVCSSDLHIFTAEDRPDFRDARYFFGEANAACALDATGHYRFHDGTHVFLRHRPLILIIAGIALAISNRLVLEIAFASLVADRTIKRVIDEEEFHHALPRLLALWTRSVERRGGKECVSTFRFRWS